MLCFKDNRNTARRKHLRERSEHGADSKVACASLNSCLCFFDGRNRNTNDRGWKKLLGFFDIYIKRVGGSRGSDIYTEK